LIGDYFAPMNLGPKKPERQRTYIEKQSSYITIASINANGKITDSTKREGTMLSTALLWARKNKADVLVIQETKTTHTPHSRKLNWFATATDSTKWGVATTAVSRTCKIQNSEVILEGRVLQTTVEKDGTLFNLLNCYFPPDIEKKTEAVDAVRLANFTGIDTVMIGDLNIIDDVRDAWPHKTDTTHPKESWTALLSATGWKDVCLTAKHTCERGTPTRWTKDYSSGSRIDRCYSHPGGPLTPIQYESVSIPGTDHEMVLVTFDTATPKRGKGYWKCNVESLKDDDGTTDILEKLLRRHWRGLPENMSAAEKWDKTKEWLREEAQNRAKKKAAERSQWLKEATEKLQAQKNRIRKALTTRDRNDAKHRIEQIMIKLHATNTYRYAGAKIRSRAKWYAQTERPTREWLQRARLDEKKSGLTKLTVPTSNRVTEDPKEIVDELKKFYAKLYDRRDTEENEPALQDLLQDLRTPENTRRASATPTDITEDTVIAAIGKLSTHTSPGVDGLTNEMYKLLAKPLAPMLVEVFREIQE
jgi:exonuclease III